MNSLLRSVECFERFARVAYENRGYCDGAALIGSSVLAGYGWSFYPLLICLFHAFCLSRGWGR